MTLTMTRATSVGQERTLDHLKWPAAAAVLRTMSGDTFEKSQAQPEPTQGQIFLSHASRKAFVFVSMITSNII